MRHTTIDNLAEQAAIFLNNPFKELLLWLRLS